MGALKSAIFRKLPFWANLVKKNQNCRFKLKFGNCNLGHNILELDSVLVQIRLNTSKTKRDIWCSKLGIRIGHSLAPSFPFRN